MHKFYLLRQALKIPDAKAAVDKEWDKLEKIAARHESKDSKRNKRCSMKQEEKAKQFILQLLWTCVISNAQNRKNDSKNCKGRVVPRGEIVKDDFVSCAVFTEQRSSASHMQPPQFWMSIPDFPGAQDKLTPK